ncbi:MAG: MFS transporter [Alphaproteobacteria bacterium]|nr:MFS transporter [Alphaproteobacteria bacterium]
MAGPRHARPPEPSLPHPFIDLVQDPPTRRVWAGLSFQSVAHELLSMAVIWLAIDMVGAAASFLPAAQFVAAFVVSILAGAVADRFSPRATMVFVNLVRAGLALVPVALALTGLLTFPTLMIAAVAMSSLRGVFDPALQSSVPKLAPSPDHIQGINGLFDSTHRLARLIGPFVGGLLSLVLPVIHFLTAAAGGYALAALAIRGVGRGLDRPLGLHGASGAGIAGAVRRMLQGIVVARRDRAVGRILAANTINLFGWILGLTLGIPMLMANHPPSGFEAQPLVALSCLLAAYGVGDFSSNVWVAYRRPVDRWRFMFSGYLVLGFAIALLPMPLVIGFGAWELPAMMAIGFVAGWGGPIFFLPMLTLLQTRVSGADIAAVFRLRIALTSGSMALSSLVGSWMFAGPGAIATVIFAGLFMAATGCLGLLMRPPEMSAAASTSTTL